MGKVYDDDDGRTVADMSGLDSSNVLSGLIGFKEKKTRKKEKAGDAPGHSDASGRAYELSSQEKKTRRLYILGAMRAGLLIGMVFLAGFAALIVLLLLIWGKL